MPSTTPPLVKNCVAIWLEAFDFRAFGKELRQTKIEYFDMSARVDHQVRGLDVAMRDAACMRGIERVGDLRADTDDFAERAADRPAGATSSVWPSMYSIAR